MAQRKNFEIRWNSSAGEQVAVKHAFNSSVRETETLISDIARAEGQKYRLMRTGLTKDDCKCAVSGFRTWQGDNGNVVTFKINIQA